MLHPTTSRIERVLAYGNPNSGRSSTWVALAAWMAKTDSEHRIYVGGTDRAYDAMAYDEITPYIHHVDLDRQDFAGWITWAQDLKGMVGRDDWVVLDKADVAWEAAQAYYIERLTGGDMLAEAHFQNQRAIETKGKEGEFYGGAHGSRWDITNKFYFSCMNVLTNLPCHLLFVADAKEIRDDFDDAAAKKAQWKVGFMPQGQKRLPETFHTWLYCSEHPVKGWTYTSIRDKVAIGQTPRTLLKGEEVTDFVLTYLVPVAGWEL